MIRHVAVFTFRSDASAEQRAAFSAALAELPDVIDEIRGYRFGPDLGLAEGTWDFAVVADFDDVAGYRTYAEHPAHRRVVTELLAPIVAERAAIQFEVPDTP